MNPFISLAAVFRLFSLALLSVFCASIVLGQDRKTTTFYEGVHYGAHNPWNYLSVVTNSKHGDTLFFERLVYRNKVGRKNNEVLQTDRVTMFVYSEDHVEVLSDTLSYNWQTGPKCYKHRSGDQIRITYLDPKKINFTFDVGHTIDIKANNMTFTSVAALELYLSRVPLRVGFEKDFWMADDVLRPFRLRVLGELMMGKPENLPVICYDISINSLDNKSLHSGKIFMNTHTREVVKREFVSNETKHKSVLHEFVQ